MNHSFDVEVARIYDVEVAIFLNHMAFWMQKNILNGNNFHKDFFWTYDSYHALTETFVYWSEKTIRTVINRCINHGLVMKDNFNHKKYDVTNWYALTPKGMELFPLILKQYYTALPKRANDAQLDLSADQSSTAQAHGHLPKRADGSAQTGRPIPDTFTDNNINNINYALGPFDAHQKAQEKSDEIKKPKEKIKLTINDLLECNPLCIPEQLLREWMVIRGKPITITVWNSMNKQLKMYGHDSFSKITEGFSEMLRRGWSTFKCDWMLNATKSAFKPTQQKGVLDAGVNMDMKKASMDLNQLISENSEGKVTWN